MADRGLNSNIRFWDDGDRWDVLGASYTVSTFGRYYPSEIVYNEASKRKCIRVLDSLGFHLYPLLPSNGKFLSPAMPVGSTYFYHDSRWEEEGRSIACRVDGKTLFVPNCAGTVSNGDTYTWEEDFTNISTEFYLFNDFLSMGDLIIEYHLYHQGVEVSAQAYIDSDTIECYRNGNLLDDYFYVRGNQLKLTHSEIGYVRWSYKSGNSWIKMVEVDSQGSNNEKMGFRLLDVDDSYVDEIKVRYTWTWDS